MTKTEKAAAEAREMLEKMTLEEKVSLLGGQGTMHLRAIPRVGLNHEWRFSDSSHTLKPEHLRWTFGYDESIDAVSTVLPPLAGLAATWNTKLAAKHGTVMGQQARARGKDQLLGPGINIMRTPLCGRNWEYLSEDPCLVSRMVVPLIKGIQKQDVAATVKHFAANAQELNRNGVDTDVDERTMREIYLPGFRAAVTEAGALSVMNAYNRFRGNWCSESEYLQNRVLRDDWGFGGFVVTDWGAMHSTVAPALAGCDVEMNFGKGILYFSNAYKMFESGADDEIAAGKKPVYRPGMQPLVDAVKAGEISEDVIDRMAFHVLFVMARCGVLSGRKRVAGSRNTKAHQAVARAIADEAAILLKNNRGVLPLDADKLKTVLLVGNLADAEHCRLGWSAEGRPPYEITPAMGIAARLGKKVRLVKAPLVASDEKREVHALQEKCIETIDEAQGEVGMTIRGWKLCAYAKRGFAGKKNALSFARKPEAVEGVKSAVWTTTIVAPESGPFVFGIMADLGASVTLSIDGRVCVEGSAQPPERIEAEAVLVKGKAYAVTLSYSEGGKNPSYVDFGWLLPSERSMPVAEVRTAAEKADAVIVLTGTCVGHGRALECEGADRPNLLLPEGHDEAIAAMLKWKIRNLVIVNHSGAPCELPWAGDCDTLLQCPYMGQEYGNALADVLFGDVNPSGKLPCTWPKRYADTPVARKGTYDETKTVFNERFYVGYRWYDHEAIEPLFPFGYGLSYTAFEYGKLRLSSTTMTAKRGLDAEVEIRNIGDRSGKETVQFYVSAVAPKVERCVRELKGFDKVEVAAGGAATAKVSLSPRDLAYYDVEEECFRADKGKYVIAVGASSRDIRSSVEIELTEDWTGPR